MIIELFNIVSACLSPLNLDTGNSGNNIVDDSSAIVRSYPGGEGGGIDIGTSLPYAVDYSESGLLEFVRPGDILYDPLGAGIQDVPIMNQDIGFGHTGIVEGIFYDNTFQQYYIRTIEANLNGVSRCLLSPERMATTNMSILRLENMTDTLRNTAVWFAIQQLGKPYDYSYIPAIMSIDSPSWFCSELVHASYKYVGIDFFFGANVIVSPSNIYESVLTKEVYRYGINNRFISDVNCHYLSVYGVDEVWSEPHDYSVNNNNAEICSYCHHVRHSYTHGWTIVPSDLDYPDYYNNIEDSKIHNLGDLTFSTTRYRTGYIFDQYLTMSAKNRECREAYLEFNFPFLVKRLDVDLALWSENESLIVNSMIKIEIKVDNVYRQYKTFPPYTLSQSKDNLTNHTIVFLNPVESFRFHITTTQVNNDNNRGRLVIGEMSVSEFLGYIA